MEGVQLKNRVAVVGIGTVWGPQVGNPHPSPTTVCLPGPSAAPSATGSEDPIFNINYQNPGKQAAFETSPRLLEEKCADDAISGSTCFVPGSSAEDGSSMVVDMGAREAPVVLVEAVESESGTASTSLEQGRNIKWRRDFMFSNVHHDPPTETRRQEGIVKNGDIEDVYQLCREQPLQRERGVICNSEVLHHVNGDYREKEQYTINPAKFKGGYGVCAMCQDVTSGKTVMRKTIQGKWKNEVLVPLQFKGMPGIPEVYGVIQQGDIVEIFQKFAGQFDTER